MTQERDALNVVEETLRQRHVDATIESIGGGMRAVLVPLAGKNKGLDTPRYALVTVEADEWAIALYDNTDAEAGDDEGVCVMLCATNARDASNAAYAVLVRTRSIPVADAQTRRIQVSLVIEHDDTDSDDEIAHQLAEHAEKHITGVSFADVLFTDDMDEDDDVCPRCQTALDEHGYCQDAGCPNLGKTVS